MRRRLARFSFRARGERSKRREIHEPEESWVEDGVECFSDMLYSGYGPPWSSK